MRTLRGGWNAQLGRQSLGPLRTAIERAVPHGSNPRSRGRDQGSRENPPETVDQIWAAATR